MFDTEGLAVVSPKVRIEVLFGELAELTGQRNAIDGRIVEIVSEIENDDLAGMTGARSLPALVAWKTGTSPRNAETIAAVAHRLREFPLCAAGMREGRLSLDLVGVIAERAAEGSDAHYVELAAVATVGQLRTAVKLEPRPEPEPAPRPEPPRSIGKTVGEESTTYRITLPHAEAATFDAALQSHHDALIAAWKRDHGEGGGVGDQAPPLPSTVDGFISLVEAGWDAEVARRPHGQRTTVVVHVDVERRIGELHLGPLLSDEDRQYLLCDASCEVWFERRGRVIGAGRETRQIGRRLRRALEHRDRCCVVPGCGATRGLHAHHVRHWEDGGVTELANWCWCARITTGCITGVASPSPVPRITSLSPTALAGHWARDRWPAHPSVPRRRSRRVAGRPGNAPTGGGMTPSSPNHHRRPTNGSRSAWRCRCGACGRGTLIIEPVAGEHNFRLG